jgi:acetyl esterase
MKFQKSFAVAAIAVMFLFLAGCESRQRSIMRENKYLAEHQMEKVAKYYDGVIWTVVDGVTLTMDISAPHGKGPFPCVMIIHGGGWTLHTNTIMKGMARYITNRGYVVFNINYRMLPDVKMEQIVNDAMGALIWVKEHAPKYGGDPARIAVTGDSSGGHLTAMILTQAGNPAFKPSYKGNGKTDLSVTCAAPSYGVFDFISLSNKWAASITGDYIGESYKQNPDRYKLLSPGLNIKPGLPPQLIIVGDHDPLRGQNESYVKALQAAGNPVELWIYKGKGHAFLNNFWDETGVKGYGRILEFLDKNLKK